MEWLTRSDILLLAIAAYVAIMTLVRLMRERRDVLVADVQKHVQSQRRAKRRQQEAAEQGRDAA
jgi:7-keto-8-aminopelargonate synthetase-like enzyme